MPPRSSPTQAVHLLEWEDQEVTEPEFHSISTIKSKALPLAKRVSFLETNKVFFIRHVEDFSDEEVAATWYSASEYGDIKASYRNTIYMMECSKNIPEGQTIRGLEYRTQEGAWARYENKRDAYNAVLDEQDLQWNRDVDDHEAIARIYLQHSSKCAEAARVLGNKDAIEAREVYALLLQNSTHDKVPKRKISAMRRMLPGALASN